MRERVVREDGPGAVAGEGPAWLPGAAAMGCSGRAAGVDVGRLGAAVLLSIPAWTSRMIIPGNCQERHMRTM